MLLRPPAPHSGAPLPHCLTQGAPWSPEGESWTVAVFQGSSELVGETQKGQHMAGKLMELRVASGQ